MPGLRNNVLSILLGASVVGLFAQFAAAAPPTKASLSSDSSGSAQSAPASLGANIFSSGADSNEIPTYKEDKGGNARLKKLIMGDGGKIPEFKTVRTIPSLTPQQRKQIREIYEASKTQLGPLVQQMRALKPSGQPGAGHGDKSERPAPAKGADSMGTTENAPAAMDAEQRRETVLQLGQQIRHLREQTWQQVKSVLSDKQLGELESMQRGELKPATFNEPQMAPGKQRGIKSGANGGSSPQQSSDTSENSGNPDQMQQQENK